MHKTSVFVVICLCVAAAVGNHCNRISGTWQNQLGSNMTIIRLEGNELFGEYSTAVESSRGASKVTSNITGTVTHLENGALVAFTVFFNHGKSLATWVGQCMMCDGEEVLHTTWILRSFQQKPVDRWMSNTINQDTFKRLRERNRNSIPRHLRMAGPPAKVERSSSCEKNLNVGDKGYWASEYDAMQFTDCYETGKLSGKYQGQPLHGRTAGGSDQLFTALGIVSSSTQEAKGWAGHIYKNTRENGKKVISSWLTHTFSHSCENPRASVQYGRHKYEYDMNHREAEVNNAKESTVVRVIDYISSFFL